MTFEEFDNHQRKFVHESIDMGLGKGKEYAHSQKDRLQNFNEISELLDISRQKVLMVYMMKHILSLCSYVKRSRTFSDESIRGRCADVLVYSTLLEAMIREDNNSAPEQRQCDPRVGHYGEKVGVKADY